MTGHIGPYRFISVVGNIFCYASHKQMGKSLMAFGRHGNHAVVKFRCKF